MKELIALFHHFFLQFLHIVEIDQKVHNATISRPPVPCILQILTTFNLYSGRPRVDLFVNNKQKVRQAMAKISLARYVSRNGLTIGVLMKIKISRNMGLSQKCIAHILTQYFIRSKQTSGVKYSKR